MPDVDYDKIYRLEIELGFEPTPGQRYYEEFDEERIGKPWEALTDHERTNCEVIAGWFYDQGEKSSIVKVKI